jgi:hypothetical protein
MQRTARIVDERGADARMAGMFSGFRIGAMGVAIAACSTESTLPPRPEPGVIYTFPRDGQLDVPLSARVVVSFSDPVVASAIAPCSGSAADPVGALCLVGPDGPLAATAEVAGDGRIVQLTGAALADGTSYAVYARAALAPTAANLPSSGPLFRFTTRSTRPRAAAPAIVAINGAAPTAPDALGAVFDSSTIRLAFSEPLDPRTVALGPGAIELVDTVTDEAVAARLLAGGIHVSIDPVDDLIADREYRLEIGGALADASGQAVAAQAFTLTPQRGRADPAIVQMLRTRAAGDRGPDAASAGADHNAIAIASSLIGTQSVEVRSSALEVELGDPALGGPLAFTIRRGQRLRTRGLDVKLGGELPVGLSTGDIVIELLSDGGGAIHRNPRQPAVQRPENDRSPLIADLALDVAVYAIDPAGNAALTQTVLGVEGSGVVVATDGVLDLEAVISIDLDLLGVTRAATNLVLEMITDAAAVPEADVTAPALLAALPSGTADPLSVDTAVELIFSEPVDLERARAGGVRLETDGGQLVPSAIEGRGAALAIHPLAPLAPGASFRVALTDVTDVAGNPLPVTAPPVFSTPARLTTAAPLAVASVHPGAPCALTGGGATTPGRCLTSGAPDDNYPLFALAANDAIDVRFTQAPAPASVTRGDACNTGSVRIEELDTGGACARPVTGTLQLRDRALSFVPDAPWRIGQRYRLTLVSGPDASCAAGEICGGNAVAASFSTLNRDGNGALVRADLVIDFTGAAASTAARAITETVPIADANGSGVIEPGELASDDNRVALRITRTTGVVTAASFPVPDCVTATAEPEACMALSGAIPVELLPLARNCVLPGGGTAPSCIPVALSPQLVLATSLPLDATAVVGQSTINISTVTGALVLRVRQPAGGTLTGYLIDDAGTPTLVAALDVYLDAPDMQIPLLNHDLHSKPLAIALRGPLRFLPDGRIAIAVSNVADVPIIVNIAGGNLAGAVEMVIPRGELKLRLASPPLRGGGR